MVASIQIQSVESLRVIVESTFASDATSSPGLGSFIYVPMNEGSASLTITKDELDPLFVVQSRYQGREKVLGKKSATLKFAMDLAPTGTAAGSAVAAVQGALGLLLKAVMGGEHLGTGTTFSAGWTAITGTVASGAGFLSGSWIGWTNASGVVEWRQCKLVSGNTITLAHGFSGTPSNGNVAYSAATYSYTEDPATTLQFVVRGQGSNDAWLLLGCQAPSGISITVDPTGKAIPTVEFTFQAANYLMAGQTAAAITGAIAVATYTNYSPIVGFAGDFRVYTVGAPTLLTTSQIHISALSFAPKIAYVPVTSPSGTNTIYRWRGSRTMPPVEGTFTVFYEDLTWFNARDNLGDYAVSYTMGTAAGSAVVLAANTVEILSPQRAASDQEIAGQTVKYEGRRNSDTAATTDLATSPVCIVLG